MWWLKGTQPEVPSPGENEKKVVYGAVDYATGRITHTVADTKSGQNFLAFLVALVTAYADRKIQWSVTMEGSTIREWLGNG